MTPDRMNMMRLDKDIEERNKPLTDEELDQLIPTEGFEVNKIFKIALDYKTT